MPRRCTICTHPQRREIELAVAAKRPFRDIASRYGITKTSLARHVSAGHVTAAVLQRSREREQRLAEDVLDQLQALRDRALAMLDQVEDRGDARSWAAVAREVRGCLELQAELLGQLRRGVGVQVGVVFGSPAWQRLSAALVEALAPYPDARAAVVRVLSEVAGGGD